MLSPSASTSGASSSRSSQAKRKFFNISTASASSAASGEERVPSDTAGNLTYRCVTDVHER
jgi:hypothetical protein